MRTIILLSTVLGLSACQPQQINQAAQQQHFICKSLIEGFLKTQRLGEYQLDHLQPTLHQTASVRAYRYRASRDTTVKVNIPTQQNLQFECQQNSAQHYEIKLVNPQQNSKQILLSLDLPSQETIDTLTAFQLKTQ
ncbi:MAG: hypothetical protein RR575_12675 [Acinetobacter sp.]